MKYFQPYFVAFLSILSTALLSSAVFAKEVTLFDQPNATAKVVGKVDLSAGVIPVYTPKDSEWIKVADPRNGNVGWIKSSDVAPGSNVTFTQQLIKENNGSTQTIQTMQVGKPVDPKELKQLYNTKPEEVQKAVGNMIDKMNQLYKQDLEAVKQGQYPLLAPVVVMPVVVPVATPPAKNQQAAPVANPPVAQPAAPVEKPKTTN